MTEDIIKNQYNPILYADLYPKKDKDELQVYATQVIDGKGWRINSHGRTYCIGPVDIIDGCAVPRKNSVEKEIPEKQSVVITTNRDEIDSSGVENPVTKVPASASTTQQPTTLESDSFVTKKNGRPRVGLPEDEILKSSSPSRVLAEKYGVSHTTITRIRKGQRVLV